MFEKITEKAIPLSLVFLTVKTKYANVKIRQPKNKKTIENI